MSGMRKVVVSQRSERDREYLFGSVADLIETLKFL
jgi:hypothetical protein